MRMNRRTQKPLEFGTYDVEVTEIYFELKIKNVDFNGTHINTEWVREDKLADIIQKAYHVAVSDEWIDENATERCVVAMNVPDYGPKNAIFYREDVVQSNGGGMTEQLNIPDTDISNIPTPFNCKVRYSAYQAAGYDTALDNWYFTMKSIHGTDESNEDDQAF